MKEKKRKFMKNSRSPHGKKTKLSIQPISDNNKNNSRLQVFEINNDPLEVVHGFDPIQTREEIVESKHVQLLDPNIVIEHDSDKDEKPKIKWGKYSKRYKSHWETDPKLKGWIQPHFDDAGKVSCTLCHCILRAHKTDLYKHAGTNKHKRNLGLSHNDSETEKKIVLALSEKPSRKKRYKTEKVATADGSYIILQTEQNVYHSEPENEGIFVNYTEADPEDEVVSLSLNRSNTDPDISDIASRIGVVLTDEVAKILRTQKNVLKFFKCNGEYQFTDANIRKVAKICVGHLSQKYIIESALESSKPNSSGCREKREFSSKFRAIEEKLEKTVAEMKDLKMSFDGVSEVLPFTRIDLGEILHTAANSR